MLAEAAAAMAIDCVLVDPVADAPLAHGERVATAFDDPLALSVLSGCDAVTVELEGVPVDVLERLARATAVRPPARAVAVSQDRLAEKDHFSAVAIPTAPYTDSKLASPRAAADVIVKSRRGGYDGRGQIRVPEGGDVDAAIRALDRPAIVEEVVAFDRELSIVAAPRGGWCDGLLSARREPSLRGHPAHDDRARSERRLVVAGTRSAARHRARRISRRTSACSRSSSFRSAIVCSPTRWLQGCTTPGIGRSKAR